MGTWTHPALSGNEVLLAAMTRWRPLATDHESRCWPCELHATRGLVFPILEWPFSFPEKLQSTAAPRDEPSNSQESAATSVSTA